MLLYCSLYGNGLYMYLPYLFTIYTPMTSLTRLSQGRNKKKQVNIKPLPTVTTRGDRDGEVEINSLMDPTAEGEDEDYFEDPSNIGMKYDQSRMTSKK